MADEFDRKMPESNNSPSGHESDGDFDPTADMMVNDFDDEHTLDEEEALDESENFDEIDDLQKEGEMPLEELLAMYGYQAGPVIPEKSVTKERAATSVPADSTEVEQVIRTSVESEDQVSSQNVVDSEPTSSSVNEDFSPETSTPSAPTTTSAQWTLPGNGGSSDDANPLLNDDSDWEDEDDLDYEEGDEETEDAGDWRRTIQVGPEHQAVIPESLTQYDDVPAYENEDTILWEPSKLSEYDVEQYLKVVKLSSSDFGHPDLDPPTPGLLLPDPTLPDDLSIRDDEQALFILLQAGHKTDEALRRRKMQSNKTGLFETMTSWSEEECREFEEGLRLFGKDFHAIQKNKVPTRTVREIVHFYYLWKKTERHDLFVSQFRIEKKKYNLHPFVTDYMDRFADEQEVMLLSSSSTQVVSNMTGSSASSPTPRPQIQQQPHVQHSMFPSSYNSGTGLHPIRNQQSPVGSFDPSVNRAANLVSSTVTSSSIVDFSTNSTYTNGHSKNTSQGYSTITPPKPVNFPLIDTSTVRRTLEATEVTNLGSSPQESSTTTQSSNLNLSGDTINCK